MLNIDTWTSVFHDLELLRYVRSHNEEHISIIISHEKQTCVCHCSASILKDSCECWNCPGHVAVKGNDRAYNLYWRLKQPCITSGLRIERSEMLRSSRHYPRAQSQAYNAIDRSPGGERRGKRDLSTIILERTRDGHHQSDKHWNCFKWKPRETSQWETGGAHIGIVSDHINIILNWTEHF